MSGSLFYNGWHGVLRTMASGVVGYVALLALLRISGKRTLSKMNAFDLIGTVALGSILATMLLSSSVGILSGLVALCTLVGLQYALAWTSVRSSTVRRFVKSEPKLLVFHGVMLRTAMMKDRITPAEVFAALRQHGCAAIEEVYAVVLETNGELSVIGSATGNASAVAFLREDQRGSGGKSSNDG